MCTCSGKHTACALAKAQDADELAVLCSVPAQLPVRPFRQPPPGRDFPPAERSEAAGVASAVHHRPQVLPQSRVSGRACCSALPLHTVQDARSPCFWGMLLAWGWLMVRVRMQGWHCRGHSCAAPHLPQRRDAAVFHNRCCARPELTASMPQITNTGLRVTETNARGEFLPPWLGFDRHASFPPALPCTFVHRS